MTREGAGIRRRKRYPRDLRVTIETLNEKGLGALLVEQEHGPRTVNVKAALPGENLVIDVITKRRGQWYARPSRVELASVHRVNAPCKNFIACGGCTLQHIDQDYQLEIKNRNLLESLSKYQVAVACNLSPVSGPKYLYRRRARMGVRYVAAKQRVLVGFREGFGGKIVEMSECLILAEPFASQLENIQTLIARLNNREKIPQIELAAGDLDAAIILRHLTDFNEQDFALLEQFHRSTGLLVFSQADGYESVKLLFGRPHTEQNLSNSAESEEQVTAASLSYSIQDYGITIFHKVNDFVQINAECNQHLVGAAVTGLELGVSDRVLELFCGVGNFSLPMARTAGAVLGLEGDAGLVTRATHNARYNGLSGRVQFEQVDLYAPMTETRQLVGDLELYNKMLIDPPRSGIGGAMALIAASCVVRLAYISCNPESFAKDAAELSALGFTLETVQVFDMFPQTSHVETLGLFRRALNNNGCIA